MSIKYMDYIIFRYAPYGYVHSKPDNSSIQILVWEGFELNPKNIASQKWIKQSMQCSYCYLEFFLVVHFCR